jgi:ArsR family transcriptional regulator, arsenate/arsenite/antimonite-responsive transcriptional repressor / arsenate reductase (thioredoxin)
LKWPPETGPNIKMITNSPAAVAAAFSSSSSPVWPGDSRWAAIPRADHHRGQEGAAEELGQESPQQDRCTAHAIILTEQASSVKIESMNTDRTSELERRAILHAALADPARLRITDTLLAGDASPSELAAMLAMPSNLLAHHLHVLEQAGLITRRRSEGDRRRTYLQLVPGALDSLAPPPARAAPRVLFVCTANSARSHLAAALWRQASTVPAASAGTRPADAIDPGAIAAAKRHGLPLSRLRPRHIIEVRHHGDLVITVCDLAHEELAEATAVHWSIADPVPAGDPGSFDTALAQLADRVTRLAPRLAAVS